MSNYTVKDLTTEFNVSRQAINQLMDKEFRVNYVKKIDNKLSINEDGYKILANHFSNGDTSKVHQKQRTKKSVNYTSTETLEIVNQLQVKDKQIKVKDKQIEKLQTLLDQQQKLTLQANKQIDALQSPVNDKNELTEDKKLIDTDVDSKNNKQGIKKHWWNLWQKSL